MTAPAKQKAILKEYSSQFGLYSDLGVTCASLLERILRDSDVRIHSITHRCKSVESVQEKLSRPDKEYSDLADITDLAGIRVTTYFSEDVDRIARLIEREFDVDTRDSIDKRTLLDPDRFGYQSLHYVLAMSSDRCRLAEYSSYEGRRFEVQVRSILQHAWAEIEHDLGYKSAAGIPRDIRRRFSRIAGLLELADDEFAAIRRALAAYAAEVGEHILKRPQQVGIDKLSLQTLISTPGSATRRLSMAVAGVIAANLDPIPDAVLESNVNKLEFLGILTIADLEEVALSYAPLVSTFAKRWLEGTVYPSFHEGIGIHYLAYVLLAEQGDVTRLRAFLDEERLGAHDEREDLARKIDETYRESVRKG